MQAWRMNADGSNPVQMTFDDAKPGSRMYRRWAKHRLHHLCQGRCGPRGSPPNKNVEIRLFPAEGGSPETLVRLFGGQGTLNVNSWAPDSKHLAFVSYRLK
jgi:hypothetical protein